MNKVYALSGANSIGKLTRQAEELVSLLRASKGQEVPLPQILALYISQFGARIFEARRAGFVIKNRTQTINGVKHSWYRLISEPGDVVSLPELPKPVASAPAMLFVQPLRSWAGDE